MLKPKKSALVLEKYFNARFLKTFSYVMENMTAATEPMSMRIVHVHQDNINVMVMVDVLKIDGDVMAGMIVRKLNHQMSQLSFARISLAVQMLSAVIINDAYGKLLFVMVLMTVVTIVTSFLVFCTESVCLRSSNVNVIKIVYQKSSGELN